MVVGSKRFKELPGLVEVGEVVFIYMRSRLPKKSWWAIQKAEREIQLFEFHNRKLLLVKVDFSLGVSRYLRPVKMVPSVDLRGTQLWVATCFRQFDGFPAVKDTASQLKISTW